MKTVHEISKSIGVSRRTLQHYDEIGLLLPTERTEANYRLYDDDAVEKLWTIKLLQELGYQLKEIKMILENSNFDFRESIGNHIEHLTKKKERLENLIGYAETIKLTGIVPCNFEEFGDITFLEFITNSKNTWNKNIFSEEKEGLSEFAQIMQLAIEDQICHPEMEWSDEDASEMAENISEIVDLNKMLHLQECIDGFKNLIDSDVNSTEVQAQIKKLYEHINDLFDQSISLNGFLMWGRMLISGGDISILQVNQIGQETAEFIVKVIETYCDKFTEEQRQDKRGIYL